MNTTAVCMTVLLMLGSISPMAQNCKLETMVNPTDSMVFVQIPRGTIVVQVEDGKTAHDELPYKKIAFDDFWMGRTEVTVGQFRKFVESTGYKTEAEVSESKWNWKNPGFLQRDDHPVVYVSFDDAKAYVKWAGVDLPYEAEWLYACYANTSTKYYWGDEMNSDMFWHRENSLEGTHPVAANMPNPWGLFDMIGNVKEYCKTIGDGFALTGESWTRCIRYRNRNGIVFDQMIANSVKKVLHISSPNPQFVPYRWDDDRGFRCVIRKGFDN